MQNLFHIYFRNKVFDSVSGTGTIRAPTALDSAYSPLH